jgi:dihydropteroate synthase
LRRPYDIPLPGGRLLRLPPERTLIMGVLNVTPDSFSDGGRHLEPEAAIAAGRRLVSEGADVLDVGGESTRPGSAPVSADEEASRVVPVVRALAQQVAVPISIDTMKADVAEAAIEAGASIVNDVSGLGHDAAMAATVAGRGAALVLMHMRGMPADMYRHATYAAVTAEVVDELGAAMQRALEAGVPREAIILDPGLGFAKRAEHSLALLAELDRAAWQALDRPLLLGPSRKSFLQAAIGERPPGGRDWATAAAVTACVLWGAHIVRVHDVAAMSDVVRLADCLRGVRSETVS